MIPHNRPTLGQSEASAAAEVIASGWVARGKETDAFEAEVAAFLGLPAKHVVVTSSGTAALFLALWALNAKNATIALPGYVCSALAHAIAMAGGAPRFVDNAADSPNIDLNAMPHDITHAIVPHMYGVPVETLHTISGTTVIEDCAQALGASVGGVATGLNGRVGITSFYATKLMTSGGQGGALFSHDAALIEQVRDYLDFDCRRDQQHRFNFQITDVASAVGRVQLRRLPEFLQRRQHIYGRYRQTGVTLLDAHSAEAHPVRYRAVVRTNEPGHLIRKLAEAGITAIVPTLDWELPQDQELPNALRLAKTTVSLPIFPSLSDEDVDRVCRVLEATVR